MKLVEEMRKAEQKSQTLIKATGESSDPESIGICEESLKIACCFAYCVCCFGFVDVSADLTPSSY